eukprot:10964895-Lingulodinium_polyedra.AAC.1
MRGGTPGWRLWPWGRARAPRTPRGPAGCAAPRPRTGRARCLGARAAGCAETMRMIGGGWQRGPDHNA